MALCHEIICLSQFYIHAIWSNSVNNMWTCLCIILLQHTNSDGLSGSKAASIAVGGHNTDNVCYIVRQNDWNTCCTGGEWAETWTDSYSVVDWSPTIILWGLPLHC